MQAGPGGEDKAIPTGREAVESGVRWYALHTRARHEKQVDRRLRERRFEAYLPLIPQVRQWHDRRKVLQLPLFPGYVFARFSLDATTRVVETPGVATVVRHEGRPAPITDEEIENVRRFAAAIAETGTVPTPTPLIEKGERVRIVSGDLKGVEGLVVERRGGARVLIQVGVRTIGQGVKLEVDAASLRAVR